uniref:Uncharacterized protein n=1 Tax=Arundo donax TaxID=35708 RepID=A0A0A9GD30_ARUDO
MLVPCITSSTLVPYGSTTSLVPLATFVLFGGVPV